jgi:hypothetical protein
MLQQFYSHLLDFIKINPTIAHVDAYKMQPEAEKTELAYPNPACFIEIKNAEIENPKDNLFRRWLVTINFHLEIKQISETIQEELSIIDDFITIMNGYIYTSQKIYLQNIELNTEPISNHPVNILTYQITITQRIKCL